ncbi:MAG TPA: TlpA disulfide reductase family protein [bacterium]|nr:TlpA disulfide reductase family protein [bacterium]
MNFSRTLVTGLAALGILGFGLGALTADSTPSGASPTASGAAMSPARPAAHKHKHKVYHAAPDAVPDFTLNEVISGKPFHLRDHIGQVVLIDFWATWCGPCRMALPHLIEMENKYGGKNFTVVGVSLDQQGTDVVKAFAQQWDLNYPVVVDTDGSLARTYGGIREIPTTVVIDREGRVVGDPLIGYRPFSDYEDLVLRALKAS